MGKRKIKVFDAINVIIMCIIIVIMVFPLWYTIVGAFNEGYDYMRGGVYHSNIIFSVEYGHYAVIHTGASTVTD